MPGPAQSAAGWGYTCPRYPVFFGGTGGFAKGFLFLGSFTLGADSPRRGTFPKNASGRGWSIVWVDPSVVVTHDLAGDDGRSGGVGDLVKIFVFTV